MEQTGVVYWAVELSFAMLTVGLVLAFVRLARGPSLPDRVVALDFIMFLLVGYAALFAIEQQEPAFLDVGIALALVAFLATVAFARYAERRRAPPPANPEGAESGSAEP
jgi:multicomponent Na+:H+ antiporter subunit F